MGGSVQVRKKRGTKNNVDTLIIFYLEEISPWLQAFLSIF